MGGTSTLRQPDAPASAERFVVQLAYAAEPEALRRWLADAPPRGRAVYACGINLPREAAGVRLVTAWKDDGRVLTLRERDPHDSRRWRFLVEKRGVGVPGEPVEFPCSPGAALADAMRAIDRRTRGQAEALMEHLRWCAETRRECPSNGGLARELELGRSPRGRARAQYLVKLIEGWGWIAAESRGRNAARVVTILTGRAKGKSTASSSRQAIGHQGCTR